MNENNGLNDHEISGLITAIKDGLMAKFNLPQWLRGVVAILVVEYLEENNLRRDKK